MDVYETLKKRILDQYPPFSTLHPIDQYNLKFKGEDRLKLSEVEVTHEEGAKIYRQKAVLVEAYGKLYTYRFGRLYK